MINFTRVVAGARRPEIKLLVAGLAVAWGIGMLTHAAQSRHDEIDELDQYAADKRAHLGELDQLLAEHENTYRRLRQVNDQLTAENLRLAAANATMAAAPTPYGDWLPQLPAVDPVPDGQPVDVPTPA